MRLLPAGPAAHVPGQAYCQTMCSYCGCRSITIIGQFSAEHEDVVDHFTDLRKACADGDAAAVETYADAMAHALFPHTEREEVSLFAEMRKDPEFTDHIDSLCSEHRYLDDLLVKVKNGDYDQFPTFEHALRQHIDREENGLFPAAAIALDGEQWERVNAAGGVDE